MKKSAWNSGYSVQFLSLALQKTAYKSFLSQNYEKSYKINFKIQTIFYNKALNFVAYKCILHELEDFLFWRKKCARIGAQPGSLPAKCIVTQGIDLAIA